MIELSLKKSYWFLMRVFFYTLRFEKKNFEKHRYEKATYFAHFKTNHIKTIPK